jgi:hypothetical protein
LGGDDVSPEEVWGKNPLAQALLKTVVKRGVTKSERIMKTSIGMPSGPGVRPFGIRLIALNTSSSVIGISSWADLSLLTRSDKKERR